jgi:DNA-binding protein YbaB
VADFSGSDIDQVLSEARKALESMRKSPTPSETPPVQGTGESAEGKVKAAAQAGGRLKSVELDPRAMRLSSEELAEHIMTAVNAALDDLRSKAPAAAASEAIDTAALGKQVEELQNQGLRQMELISQALNETIAKIPRR